MRVRVLGAAAIMVVVGLVAGGAAAYVAGPAPSGSGVAAPVPGSSPDYPTTPARPTIEPVPDIDYPTLVPPTEFDQRMIGRAFQQQWHYPSPSTWRAYCVVDGGAEEPLKDGQVGRCAEVRFRPADEPATGGFSMRVKGIDQHVAPTTMVAQKIQALEDASDLREVTVLQQTESRLYVTVLTPRSAGGYLLRYNFFQVVRRARLV